MTRKYKRQYSFGSVSHATMRTEDLIPTFLDELASQLKRGPSQRRETRKAHFALLNDRRPADEDFYGSGDDDSTLEELFDALDCYAAPYFYFGAHPGDGSDYGYWLSEMFDEDFDGLKVNDTSEVPRGYKGEVLHVNDHGNMTLYVSTSRGLREVWGIV